MKTSLTRSWRLLTCLLVLLALAPRALAHNLDTRSTGIQFADDFIATMAGRASQNQALVQVGDEFWVLIKTTAGPGTPTGVGGYQTYYIPPGVQVVDVAYALVTTNDPRGFIPIPMKGQSPIAIGAGPIGATTTPFLTGLTLPGVNGRGVNNAPVTAVGVHRGTISGVYADTGVFYSTSPLTAFNSYGAAPTGGNPPLINNSGDTVGEWDAANILGTNILGVMTRWDSWQLRAFGRKSAAIIDPVDQRGNAPWGMASPVAGPQSGYAWAFNYDTYVANGNTPLLSAIQPAIEIGPWQRIRYPGSQISADQPGLDSQALGYTGVDASTLGYALSPANPLPPNATAVRFAIGQLELGRSEYSAVKVRVLQTFNQNCYTMYADAFGGDAGGTSNGKDHIWRYFDPTVVQLEPCTFLSKKVADPHIPPGGTTYFDITFANLGSITFPNVVLRDVLPAGLAFVSSVPAPSTISGSTLTWSVGTVAPGQMVSVRLFVRATGIGSFLNTVTAAVDGQVIAQAEDTVDVGTFSLLREVKTVTPSAVAPGQNVNYTITVFNDGPGPNGVPLLVKDYLPAGFTYVSFTSATVNGAAITPTVISTNLNQPIFVVNQGIQPDRTLVINFVANVGPNTPVGTYYNGVGLTFEGKEVGPHPEAPVTVAGGQIGDTVFRDWNGNGTQDADEEGMPGVTVTLTGSSGTSCFPAPCTLTTGANGQYLFTGLLPGNYTVSVPTPGTGGVPSGYTLTADPDGGAATLSYAKTLGLNETFLGADWGYRPGGPGSIGDQVFEDVNKNGVWDSGEPGIPNVTVWLYEDANGNGWIDAGDARIGTNVSSVAGLYGFGTLATNLGYLALVDTSDPDLSTYFGTNSFLLTTNNPLRVVNLTGSVTNVDFGFFRNIPALIGDQVFLDANTNGVYDAGDAPIANVQVSLYTSTGTLLTTTNSNASGLYTFGGLPAGTYTVVVDASSPNRPAGSVASIIGYTNLVVLTGTNITTVDFPFVIPPPYQLLSKTVSPTAPVKPGDTLTYTLVPNYTNNALLTDVTVTDPVPAGTAYQDGSANAGGNTSGVPSTVTWNLGTVIPGTNGFGLGGVGSGSVTSSPSADSWLNSGSTASNYGSAPTNRMDSSGGGIGNGRPVLRFDLSGIPGGAVVTGARLLLYATNVSATTARTVELRQLTNDWAEGEVTWANRLTGIPWATAGGGFGATTLASTAVTNAGIYYTWTNAIFTTLVSNWVQGVTSNYGIIVGDTATGTVQKDFASREASTNRPMLIVDYIGGVSGPSLTNSIIINRSLLASNSQVTVTMNLSASSAVNGVTPTLSPNLVGGATATLVSGPTPSSLNINPSGSFTWVYTLKSGSSTGAVTFTGSATGSGTDFPAARANTVLVTPPLTFRVTATSTTGEITNVSYLADTGNIPSTPSPTVTNSLMASIGDTVWADLDGSGTQNGGELGIPNVRVVLYTGGGTSIATNTTDPFGFYTFYGLTNGSYSVQYDYSTVPAGYVPTTPNPLSVTLTNYQQYTLADFGLRPPAPDGLSSSIGDLVWADLNNNGVLDGSEYGLSNVVVHLYADLNANGVVDVTDLLLATNATSTAGLYTFGSLNPGPYIVQIQGATIPAGMDWVSPVGGTNGAPNDWYPVTLGNSQIFTNADFGYNWTGQIGDYVWWDANVNGVPNGGELPIQNAQVLLYVDANNNGILDLAFGDYQVASTYTDVNGNYLFTHLPPGRYLVDVYEDSIDVGGGVEPVPTTAMVVLKDLAPGEIFLGADFGYLQGARVEGTVFWDANRNGILEPGETGLTPVLVTLTGTDMFGNPVTRTTTTDPSGFFFFVVPEGNYTVTYSTPNVLAIDPTLSDTTTPTSYTFHAYPGEDWVTVLYFGVDNAGRLGDTIFADVNSSGGQDPGEAGLGGVTVQLWKDNNNDNLVDGGDVLLDSQVTDASGHYTFLGLADGNYVVRVLTGTLPGGYLTTPTAQPPTEVAVSGNSQAGGTITGGNSVLDRDWGYPPAVTTYPISGTVWNDANGNGVLNGGEAGIPSVSVTISVDADGPGGNPPVIYVVPTDSNGNYTLAGVPSGATVIVTVSPGTLPNGAYVQTGDPDQPGVPCTTCDHTTTFTMPGAPVTGKNFGYQEQLGSISGTVAKGNGNGIYEPTLDVPLAGAVITLRYAGADGILNTSDDVVYPTYTTTASGAYSFANLPPGWYSITEANPPGYLSLADRDGGNPDIITVNLAVGQNLTGQDFEDILPDPVIGDYVWLDENSNGIQDAGEAGIPNAYVVLYNTGPDLIAHTPDDVLVGWTMTDASGYYLFKGLSPNTFYHVGVIASSLPAGLAANQTYDPDGTMDNHTDVITPANGGGIYTVDFGYNWATTSDVTGNTGTGAIGDRVWIDANGNGRQDLGEAGLGGVTVQLWYDSNNDGEIDALYPTDGTQTTRADGSYIFDTLPAGIYEVRVTAGITGYTQTGDPDAVLDNRTTSPIVLAPGDVFVNADFGYLPPASNNALSGTVYRDLNADGSLTTPPDIGVTGVSVALVRDTDGDGVWTPAGADGVFGTADDELVVATTLSGVNGAYGFAGLPDGKYIIWVNDTGNLLVDVRITDDPQGPLDGLASVDLDSAGTNPSPVVVPNQNFGYTPLGHFTGANLIGDTVYLDVDGNGTQDPGEPGLQGVTVEIWNSTHTTLLGTAITDAQGHYFFGGLADSTYQVEVVTATLPGVLSNTGDPDGGNDSLATVSVSGGAINLLQDFGYHAPTPNTISGTVWEDLDADGLMEITSPGRFAGVTVVLRDIAGNVVSTAITDAGGNYAFTGLPDGTYQVDVTDTFKVLLGLWKSVGPNPGADENSQPDPYTVTVSGGQVNTTADFGYYRSIASVGDRVWGDLDDDGLQDPGEPGLPGVKVTLTILWPNLSTTKLVTYTDASGLYRFDNLLLDEQFDGAGANEPNFTLSAATPVGYQPTLLYQGGNAAIDSENPAGAEIAVAQGQYIETYDFGFVALAQHYIRGTVYADSNNDSMFGGDTPLGGLVVRLYAADGTTLIGSTVTHPDGSYEFSAPGGGTQYVVKVVVPSGFTPVTDIDGNGNGANYIEVTLNNADVTGQDFLLSNGLANLRSISGTVWEDGGFGQPGDGDFGGTPPDAPIIGVRVDLYVDANDDGVAHPSEYFTTAVTDLNGAYSFPNLPAGKYLVVEVDPFGATSVKDVDGGNPNLIAVTLASENIVGRDFLDDGTQVHLISGTVYNDRDGTGTFSGGDQPIPGVTVRLYANLGLQGIYEANVDILLATAVTDGNGFYQFPNLPEGSYFVIETDPAGVVSVTDAGEPDPNTDNNTIHVQLVVTDVTGRDFLDRASGAIGDYVWYDENADGVQDAGEAGIRNVLVELYTDADGNPATVNDWTLVGRTFTDLEGRYLFPNLMSGNYVVRIPTLAQGGTLLPSFSNNPTYDRDGDLNGWTLVNLLEGQLLRTADFGYTQTTPTDVTQNEGVGVIGDRVWIDANGNGQQDPGEPGYPGIIVSLVGPGPDGLFGTPDDEVLATLTTDYSGFYSFTGLAAGAYVVKVANGATPGGYIQTGDPDGTLDNQTTTPILLAPGDVYLNADFGYQPLPNTSGTVSGTLWFDTNGNGQGPAGTPGGTETTEPFIPGVTVSLIRDLNGNGIWNPGEPIIATTFTDVNGYYEFTGLSVEDGVGLDDYLVWVNDISLVLRDLSPTYDSDGVVTPYVSAALNLTVAGNDLQDFGFNKPSNLLTPAGVGYVIFLDRNNNGLADPGEGLEGVTVGLYDATGTTLLQTFVTGEDGYYLFAGLAAGTYVVKVDTTTLPGNSGQLTNTADPDGGVPSQSTVTLSSGEVNLLQNFGYQPTANPNTIGGTIWNDVNADGIRGGEPGVYAGVTVVLRNPAGQVVAQTTTDANGDYAFVGIPDGTYQVDVTDDYNLLNGLWHSYGDQSVLVDNTSKADPYTLTVNGGAIVTTVDFGYYNGRPAAVGNWVWNDLNGNGIQDPLEPGLPGVEVTLTVTYANNDVAVLMTLTDANGYYNFGDLLMDENFTGNNPGSPTFVLTVATPASFFPSPTGAGTAATDSNDPNGTTASVVKGTINDTYDFGYLPAGSIGDYVWNDLNGDGIQDANEPPLGGVDLTLTWAGPDGDLGTTGDNQVFTTTTAPDGSYTFADLPPGKYVVVSTTPDGYQLTTSPLLELTLTPGQVITTADFGFQGIGIIGDFVWVDLNGDGVQDPDEPGLPGVTLTLTWAGPDGNLGTAADNVTWTTPSQSDGSYAFMSLPPGNYSVASSVPSGYARTTLNSPYPVTLEDNNGYEDLTADFGFRGTGSIGDYAWNDLNGDGVQDPGEPPLGGVKIILEWAGPDGGFFSPDDVSYETTTAPDGSYSFPDLAPGDYLVIADGPNGYQSTTSVFLDVTLSAGENYLDADFGFLLANRTLVLGDRVWLDENSNGLQDAGERGIANVAVELYDDQDNLVATTFTDSDGGYLFTYLDSGIAYRVQIVTSSMPPELAANPTADRDGTLDNVTVVTLLPGQNVRDADFGYNWASTPDVTGNTGLGAIGDRVWIDANGNGLQEPGEAGLGGVTVELWHDSNADGVIDALLSTATTAADGSYIFPTLPPGLYQVRVAAGTTGYTQTGDPDQPGVPCSACDNLTTTPILLAPGDVYVNADFGYQPTAGHSIGNLVFLDANRDGIFNGQDTGIAGVTVALIADLDGNGTWDLADPIIATTTTDSAGAYSFPGLPDGKYIVWVNDIANLTGKLELSTGDPDTDDNGQDSPYAVTLAGADVNYADFGYSPFMGEAGVGVIGDTIYLDLDGSGTQDPGEPGLQGVVVQLWNSDGSVLLAADVTDQNGQYLFSDLPVGSFLVKVVTGTLPGGLTDPMVNTGDPDGGFDSQSLVGISPDGRVRMDMDFGYQDQSAPNTISGTVWNDANADGTLGVTETTGYPGVTVTLKDLAGNVIATTTTDSDGNYAFTGLPDGTYLVDVTDANHVLNGLWHSTGSNPDADNNSQLDPYTVTVSGGANNTTADFGYYNGTPAALGNWVWNDADGNGIQDNGEVGLPGVTVKLTVTYSDTSVVVLTTQTDANGYYSFANLLFDENYTGVGAGNPAFVITVTQPTSFYASPLGAGTPETDSNNPLGTTAIATKGTINDTYDFGFIPTSIEITADSYCDKDAPWVSYTVTPVGFTPGPNPAKIEWVDSDGVVVQTLLNQPLTGTLLWPEAAVDGSGYGVAWPGWDFQAGQWVQIPTKVRPAAKLRISVNPTAEAIVLYPSPASDCAAGPYVSLGNLVFADLNNNGHFDPLDGETGIDGVTLEIWSPGADSVVGGGDDYPVDMDPLTPGVQNTTVTANGGWYLFNRLISAKYYVRIPAEQFGAGGPLVATVSSTGWGSNGSTDQDLDENGVDNASPAVNGIVSSVIDLQANVMPTDEVGPPTGINDISDNLTLDFGFAPAFTPATVTGHVYYDINGNGQQDPGEPNLANVSVTVTDSTNGVQTLTTGADGVWTAIVPPGSTTVLVVTSDPDFTSVVPAGWVQTEGDNPTTVIAVVGPTPTDAGNDGFFTPGTVTGHVYYDVNGNGQWDAGEPNLANVTVTVTDSTNGVQMVTTGADGKWTATVPPGTTVAEVDTTDSDFTSVVPAGWVQTEGNNPTFGTAVAGVSTSLGNDGFFTPGTVTGHVYYDVNGNGQWDAGEPNLADVTVTVTDSTNGVQMVTTGADGRWTATVPPGTTVAEVDTTDSDFTSVVPAGWVQTEGNNPTFGTAVAGVSTSLGNDGFFTPGTVSGHVYYDANGNGVQDSGEPDLPNVTVTVTNSTNGVQTVTTGADGKWIATVPPGSTTALVDTSDPDFTSVVPPFFSQTEGTNPTTVTAEAGKDTFTDNDGFASQYIDGYVFKDVPSAGGTVGLYDPGHDVPLPLIPVYITNSLGDVMVTVTDDDGYFKVFVPAGFTKVWVDQDSPNFPPGLVLTTDAFGEGSNPTTKSVPVAGSARDNTGYIKSSPTLASLASITARADAGHVTVRWVMVTEAGTVGYDLQRETTDGAWVTVNADTVFAWNSVLGGSYEVPDAGARARQTYRYQVVEYLENGDTLLHGPYSVTVTGDPGVPVTLTSVSLEAGQLRLTWQGESGSYYVERTASLGADAEWTEVPLAEPEATSILVPIEGDAGYFRVFRLP